MAESRVKDQDQGPAAYGREALAEWRNAARYGLRALASARRGGSDEDRPSLKERLNPSKTTKGGRLGDVADLALSKFGTPGKLASKVSLGSRILDRVRGSDGEGDDTAAAKKGGDGSEASPVANGNVPLSEASVPIVESIDVGIPLESAYRLCGDFDQYPEFLEHVLRAERVDSTHAALDVKVHGRARELEIEILDERPNERIEWECSTGAPHSGVITLHRLAPRLTRLELTIEPETQGLIDRLSRAVHLTDRTVRDELHRFKAFAELFEEDSDEPESSEEAPDEELIEDEEGEEVEDEEDLEPDDVVDDEIEADEEIEGDDDLDDVDDDDLEDAYEDEDFEDEEDFVEDEEDLEDEEDFDEDEELDEGELEPAGSER